MMELLEIRLGKLQEPAFYDGILPHWPEREHGSGFLKEPMESVVVTHNGLEGNEIGFPTHIANASFRAALVVNELVYQDIERAIPGSSQKLTRGCFGENFVVNAPDLHPGVVCVGDVYRIGSVTFQVTGPRMPCPKVDAFVGVPGIAAIGKKTGWTGYFLAVLSPGKCSTGDVFVLLDRPHPSFTISRVANGLWGDEPDNTVAFLNTLSEMEFLMPRHFRETAKLRLERITDHRDAA